MTEQEQKQNIYKQGEMPSEERIAKEKLEKLKQEIAEMEKQLAAKRIETGAEAVVEQPKAEVAEGAKGIEVSEPAATPAIQAQIQQQSQQISSLDYDNQVKALCELAFQKGLDFAIKTARDLNNPYILDEFHDTLVDELYKRLVEEKKLEEI